MSESTLSDRGVFVQGTKVGFEVSKKNPQYADVYVSVGARFAPLRFSAKVGSEFALALQNVPDGSTVVLETSQPRMATSKGGASYLQWFIVAVEAGE